MGTFLCWAASLPEILGPSIGDELASWMSCLANVFCAVGQLIGGPLAQRYFDKRLKRLILGCYCALLPLFVLFTLSNPTLGTTYLNVPNWVRLLLLFVLAILSGMYIPPVFELAAEITYPQVEAMSAGWILLFSNLGGFIFLALGTVLKPTDDNLVAVVGTVLITILILFSKERYFRAARDEKPAVQPVGTLSG